MRQPTKPALYSVNRHYILRSLRTTLVNRICARQFDRHYIGQISTIEGPLLLHLVRSSCVPRSYATGIIEGPLLYTLPGNSSS